MSLKMRACRLFTIVWLMILVPLITFAQGNMEDVVYLKNGSVIHGVIIEQVPNVSIKIQTADRNVFVFRIEEVEKITKEAAPKPGRAKKTEQGSGGFSDDEMKKHGYSLIAELNMGVGYNEFGEKSSFGMQVINGYQVNPHFNVGLGIGLNQHFAGAAFAPVFLDLRVNFLPKRVTPFIDLAGGWAFGLVSEEDEGGVYANPAFGVKFFVSRNTAMQLSVGFRYQEGVHTVESWNIYNGIISDSYEQRFNRNAATLRFGVTF